MVNGINVFWRRDLEVYPSPASEHVTVDIPDSRIGAISIINMQGQLVWHQERLSGSQSIEICDLLPGIYSVEFVPERNKERVVYTQKISVVR